MNQVCDELAHASQPESDQKIVIPVEEFRTFVQRLALAEVDLLLQAPQLLASIQNANGAEEAISAGLAALKWKFARALPES